MKNYGCLQMSRKRVGKMNCQISPAKLMVSAVAIVLLFQLSLNAQAQYAPVLKASDNGRLGITLVNPTTAQVRVTLTARNYSGALIEKNGMKNPATLTLPASSQRALQTTEIFGDGISGQTGWVEVASSNSAIKGSFVVFDPAFSYMDGSELSSAGSNRLIFPKVSSGTTAPTRLTLVNVTKKNVQGKTTLYDNSG